MKALESIRIGDLELKNRYVMVAMGPDIGDFGQRAIDYYVRRAKGGASMIMVNVMATKEIDGPTPSALLNEESYDGFKELVDRCHKYDCKVCIQIMPGVGLQTKAPDREKPSSASATPIYPGSDMTFHELTKEEIKFIQGEVSKTLKLAKKAGVDAVEIHAYGGYLTDKFMTERWNIRTDEYGGSFENRMRFLNEIIDNTKEDLGEDFPLIVKFTPNHYLPAEDGYRDIEEGLKIAKMLEEKGVHALHIDVGCHDNWYMAMPPIYQQDMVLQMEASRQVKKVTSLPIISNGRLGDIGKAEKALENGWIDIVGVGRGFLTDPDFPNKVMENRTDEIRYCIYCNEGCINSVSEGRHIDCAVNPETGYEGVKTLKKTDDPKKILVIGAGPGGCHAAIAAAEAGHDVEIWEREERLGGNFYNACLPPFKRDGIKVLHYYRTMLDRLNIRIKYCKEATPEEVLRYNPDKVINATGGTPIRPRSIKGIDKDNVTTATDVLQNKSILGDNIVIVGAGLVGCETGIVLANKGKKITIIEMMDSILPEPVFIQNLMMLTQLLDHPNIETKTSTKLMEIRDDSIIVSKDGVEEQLYCDNVVLAMGFAPNNGLYEELKDKIDIVNIGDSVQARRVLNTVKEAHDAILAI
ncbi:MAG TPA: FAD-dependent oxidoreductase [Tepidimicrobium sp.]|nr:FAD-dependent oxidoreductase [Tepidimicrobium sp.]